MVKTHEGGRKCCCSAARWRASLTFSIDTVWSRCCVTPQPVSATVHWGSRGLGDKRLSGDSLSNSPRIVPAALGGHAGGFRMEVETETV